MISAALKTPEPDGTGAAYEYTRGLSRESVQKLMTEANLGGLADIISDGIEKLQHQVLHLLLYPSAAGRSVRGG